jgi:putative ABC transport system permease protein
MVRTRPDAPLTPQTAIRAIQRVDPGQPVSDFSEMEHIRVESLVPDRLSATAVGLIAACGLLLTLIGTFGASKYVASQQKHEIGVRLVLGATARDILYPQAWRSVRTAFYGIAGGEALALLLKPVVAAFGGTLTAGGVDAVAIGLLLLVTSVAAAMIPAWQGTQADPMNALRQD